MLNKLKVMLAVGIVLQILRLFVPSIEVPADFEVEIGLLVDQLFVVIPVIVGWFVPESVATVDNLVLK